MADFGNAVQKARREERKKIRQAEANAVRSFGVRQHKAMNDFAANASGENRRIIDEIAESIEQSAFDYAAKIERGET